MFRPGRPPSRLFVTSVGGATLRKRHRATSRTTLLPTNRIAPRTAGLMKTPMASSTTTAVAFPDVALVSENDYDVIGQARQLSAGTSMAWSVFASIINLVNEDRLKANKSVVGFINYGLYQMAADPKLKALNDITTGEQSNGSDNYGTKGFSAVPGWDPVAGPGSPNYHPGMISS
ncbi:hypothetical protein NLG97_g6755 [Lecanicillium saksenae]|uniref:Uncharacterized protein n=1 Tax=Lecanicillium saksenae TaxID=468837 RepID=A0ACC1QRB4_9HYPO|nr:hypothetical protein NLG97_g6755 [Lecanicillium saksenae]